MKPTTKNFKKLMKLVKQADEIMVQLEAMDLSELADEQAEITNKIQLSLKSISNVWIRRGLAATCEKR